MPHGRSSVSLSDLITRGSLSPGQELRLRGRPDRTARVEADGCLLVNGKRYRSPSTAANGILGGNSNGWLVWKVRVGDEWVVLDTLRSSAIERTRSK